MASISAPASYTGQVDGTEIRATQCGRSRSTEYDYVLTPPVSAATTAHGRVDSGIEFNNAYLWYAFNRRPGLQQANEEPDEWEFFSSGPRHISILLGGHPGKGKCDTQPSKLTLQRMRVSNAPDMQPQLDCWAQAASGFGLDYSVTAAGSVSGYPVNVWGGALWQQ
ncbi:hypothetical protein CLCR_10880 [Cladophialophora carrionii]|uniref:Uncharacterized protein n=1 Tax=Cladophialophora carrionii TaxID=86049 RepID=A0A1C1CYT3_9EURO|nr:hypothetical protein CLCR_10880 [Cladophialophora carrionii]